MTNGLTLYLCEKEDAGDFHLRELDIFMAMQPSDSVRRSLYMTAAEIGALRGTDARSLQDYLFSRFGISDLSSKPGLPKGPYYSVDKDVYTALA